ncbi:MFS transporter [Sphingoaurantiacus capsulatus]|uniref:MFS transporter n=1 Tax=Sphingoaurantiacus capsulatus TaxID=1771310 RepID=A0ABV7X7T9_9SPHN
MTAALPRRDFGLLFAVLLVVAAGNTALQSVLPAVGRAIQIPDMLIAIIFSFSALFWTVSAPFWARQSDMRGRKRLMQLGMAGFAVSTLLCAFALLGGLKGVLLPIGTFILFAAARCLFGLFGSASNPAAQAYVAGRTSEAERTKGLATLSSAFGLGTILGPAVAPLFILPWVTFSGPLFAFAFIAIGVLIAITKLLPDDTPTPRRGAGAPAAMPSIGGTNTGAHVTAAQRGRGDRIPWRDPRIRPFVIYGFVIGSIQAATGQALGFFIIDRLAHSPQEAQPLISVTFMAGAAATLLAQWGLIRMLDLRPGTLMRWGAALAAIGTLGIAIAPNFHGLVVAYALASLGNGFARPGFTAGASLMVGEEDQGSVAGAITAVNGSCFIFAPAIGIGLYELNPPVPYLLGAAGAAALFAYAWFNRTLSRNWEVAATDQPTDNIH